MSDDELPPEVKEYFRRLGKKYGSEGGKARAQKLSAARRKRIAKKASDAAAAALTPEQRKQRAQKAAQARWGKKRDDEPKPS